VGRGCATISRPEFDAAADAKNLTADQRKIVELHLRERGFEIA